MTPSAERPTITAAPSRPATAPERSSKNRPLIRRLVGPLVVFLLASTLGFFFIAGYLAQYLSGTVRTLPDRTPAEVGLAYREVAFPASVDGLSIRGWWIPSPGASRTVIYLHGKDGNRASGPALDLARDLHDDGYNALLFDFRGSGQSEGDRFSLGHYEVRDVSGAIDYLEAEHPDAAEQIGVIGFSMGAGTAMLAAGRNPRIDAVVEDSGYATVIELVEREVPRQSGLPEIFIRPTVWMGWLLQGYDVSLVRPIEQMPALADRPLLIIHGTDDRTVPVEHAYRLRDAADQARSPGDAPFETWILASVGHVQAYAVAPEEYEARVLEIFRAAFGGASRAAEPDRPAA